MTKEDFLLQIKDQPEIRLIGPLLQASAKTDLPIIYVDGGLKHKPENAHLSFSLGDGDSSPLKPELLFNPEKDASDLELALTLLPEHVKTIHLDGFLGERKDHEWINQGITHSFLKTKEQTKILFENKILALSKGQWTIPHQGLFSLLCFEPTHLTLTGEVKYKYETQQPFPALSSRGLSNESKKTITLKNNAPVFLYINA